MIDLRFVDVAEVFVVAIHKEVVIQPQVCDDSYFRMGVGIFDETTAAIPMGRM